MAPRDADRTLPLPTSALFDPTLPMLAAHALSLRVPAAEVPGASGAGASDVGASDAIAAGASGAGAESGAGSTASDALRLTLTPRSEVQEPGTEARVDISLTDAEGDPVAGEVLLVIARTPPTPQRTPPTPQRTPPTPQCTPPTPQCTPPTPQGTPCISGDPIRRRPSLPSAQGTPAARPARRLHARPIWRTLSPRLLIRPTRLICGKQ